MAELRQIDWDDLDEHVGLPTAFVDFIHDIAAELRGEVSVEGAPTSDEEPLR